MQLPELDGEKQRESYSQTPACRGSDLIGERMPKSGAQAEREFGNDNMETHDSRSWNLETKRNFGRMCLTRWTRFGEDVWSERRKWC